MSNSIAWKIVRHRNLYDSCAFDVYRVKVSKQLRNRRRTARGEGLMTTWRFSPKVCHATVNRGRAEVRRNAPRERQTKKKRLRRRITIPSLHSTSHLLVSKNSPISSTIPHRCWWSFGKTPIFYRFLLPSFLFRSPCTSLQICYNQRLS